MVVWSSVFIACFLTINFQTRLSFRLPSLPRMRPSTRLSSASSNDKDIELRNKRNKEELSEMEEAYKREAMEILDCLTCPKDESDPAYDAEKDYRRDEYLINTDYTELKIELKRRGLRTSGDKLEMMIRFMLHVIEPSVNFAQMTGREANLEFVGKEDVASGKVKVISEDMRNVEDLGPDAEDLAPLRKAYITSPSNTVPGMNTKVVKPEKPKLVMDGLTRKELEFPTLFVKSNYSSTPSMIRAYVVGGRDVLRTWEKISPMVVVVPDELGWRNKENRVFADEIAFYNQAIVILPDIAVDSSTNYHAAFDAVVSALHFSRTEYSSKAVSMAGIGIGGGFALTVAAELGRCSTAERRELWERLYEEAYVRRSLVIGAEDEMDHLQEKTPVEGDEEGDESVRQLLEELRSLQGNVTQPEILPEPLTLPQFFDANRKFYLREFSGPFSFGVNSSLTIDELSELIPCAVFAVNPCHYSVADVGTNIISPLYAVFGDQGGVPGCR